MSALRTAAALAAALLTASLVLASGGSQDPGLALPRPVPDAVLTPALAGDLVATHAALAKRMTQADPAGGLWLYADALSLERLGKLEDALETLTRLEHELPDGPFVAKSRYARARVLGNLGRHAEAAAILGTATRALGSEQRRDELARTCTQLANQLLATAGSDPAALASAKLRASAVLEEALKLAPSEAVALDLHSRLAQLAKDLGQFALELAHLQSALELLESPAALDHTRLELAAANVRAKRLDTAIDLFARFAIESATQSPALLAAAERGQARALVERSRGSDRADALALFTRYLAERPDAAERVPIATERAELLERQGKDASEAWRQVLATRAALPEEALAASELVRAATARLGQSLLKAERFAEASDTFQSYIARYPNGPEWASCQTAIFQIELAIADNHRKAGDFAAARAAWRSYLDAHPLDTQAAAVTRRIADSFTAEADELEDASAASALFDAAIDELERLAQKRPGTNPASSALLEIGDLQETRLENLDAAIAAWRRCDFGSSAGAARMRLARVQGKSLRLTTPRVQRTDEPASVELTTRNLASVEVELYQLDLESYFRRHGGYAGIADLDLDLIQADAVFTHAIHAPSPHSQVTEELELPAELVSGPGTWVVSILSDTERATTLLLVSDIDVILETHGDDAVVFAEDMLTLAPRAGVAVLVVQAGKLHNGTTDEQGLVRFALAKGAGELALFASHAGHVASLGISKFSRQSRPHGPAGFVYTDRGVYRAGERVHWKALLRSRTADGQLVFRAGRKFDVEVQTPNNVPLFQDVLTLGAFGTLFGDVELPESAPRGIYSISIHDGAWQQTGSFEVREFALPTARLELEPERKIVLPGQSQTLRFTATYAHGAPFAAGRITGRIGSAGALQFDLVTDADGKAELQLDAKQLAGLGVGRVVHFDFTLEAETSAAGAFFLVGRELVLGLTTQRALYLAGESFAVDITSHDIFGAATAREAELEVIRLEINRSGKRYERTIETQRVHTDDAGRAVVALRLDEGGSYRLELRGTDALGQPVSAELALEIAPPNDGIELRFLADSTRFELGDEVELRLHNNGPAGPALLTRLGRGILHDEVIQLRPGDNTIRFTATIDEAPGAAVRVSRMHAAELHSASQRFEVTRDLVIAIVTPKPSYAPGEVVEVELRVTDKHGRAVATELSLGLVDAAFFDLFGERYPGLLESFPLGSALGALGPIGSSAAFHFDAPTREIPAALLAEEQRASRETRTAARKAEAKAFLGRTEQGGTYRGAGDMKVLRSSPEALAALGYTDSIELGGGAGGSFGGRSGGRAARIGAAGSSMPATPGLENPTRYWAPAVVTDAEGRATLRIQLPQTGGRWRFCARGIDATSRVGETTAVVETRADFLVELVAPGRLFGGDKLIPRARIFWSGDGPAKASLTFTSQTQGSPAEVTEYQVEFEGPGVKRIALSPVEAIDARGVLLLDLKATLDTGVDFARDTHRIDVLPYGIELEQVAGGFLVDKLRTRLAIPGGSTKSRRLDVYVGAGLGAEIIDAALGRTPFGPLAARAGLGSSTLDLASDLAGACAVLKSLEAMGPGSAGEAALLRRRVARLSVELVLVQSSDGSFGAYPGWTSRGRTVMQGNVEVTAMALFAMHQASTIVGTPKAAIDRAGEALTKALASLATDAYEARAMALFALASSGRLDSDQLGRLWRVRPSLSPAAKAYLALAYHVLGRKQQAAELGHDLEQTLALGDAFDPKSCGLWNRDPRQQSGLFLWALARALPRSPALQPAAERLLAGAPWFNGRVRGPALLGLVAWQQEALTQPAGLRAKLRIFGPGDTQIERELRVARGRAGTQTSFEVPDSWGPVELELELISDGRRPSAGWKPTWHARLAGFTSDFRAPLRQDPSVSIDYRAVAPVIDHVPLRTGFGILKGYRQSWTNEVAHLARGERVRGWIFTQSPPDYNLPPGDRDRNRGTFSEIEVAFPAGCMLVPGSVYGTGSNWQLTPTGLIAQLNAPQGMLQFQLQATSEGAFRAPPVVARSATDPSQVALSEPSELTILAPGAPNPDPYRATPDERLDRGTRLAEAGQSVEAKAVLLALFDEYEEDLHRNYRRQLASQLLDLSVLTGDGANAVRFFELLRTIDPSAFLPLESVMAIGDAYVSLGEPEPAATLFQATLAERFRRDMAIVGMLDRYAGFSASTRLQEELWHAYPDDAIVVETRLALTDALLTHAPTAHTDPELAAAGRDEVALTLEAILFLREFLLLYPDSELVAQAGTNLLQAYTSLEDYPRAAALAERLAARFDEPQLRDDFRYTRAVSLWFTGDEDGALELLGAIAEARYPSGRTSVPSANRTLATYMMGQIRHAQGHLEAADALYKTVAAEFPDARELEALFQRRALSLDEVATVRPGERAHLTLSSKGLDEVELQVYPVDLMALLLREGDLDDVSNINLAGITPVLRTTRKLDPKLAMRPTETELELEPFEAGAYLVILRGGELFATGLVVVTDLDLFVEEDAATGGVRCEVTEGGKPLAEVDVRVVGAAQPKHVFAGKTDRRGLFKASGVAGQATVIVRKGRLGYAFHRGQISLTGGHKTGSADWFLGSGMPESKDKVDWLQNVSSANSRQIMDRTQSQIELRSGAQTGIQLQDVK